jgi:hypothetical protein
MTGQASSIFVYDPSITWTENHRRGAHAIVVAADHEIVEPSDNPEGDAALAQWERESAAETIRYFETEHDDVVAEAERHAATARSNPLTGVAKIGLDEHILDDFRLL